VGKVFRGPCAGRGRAIRCETIGRCEKGGTRQHGGCAGRHACRSKRRGDLHSLAEAAAGVRTSRSPCPNACNRPSASPVQIQAWFPLIADGFHRGSLTVPQLPTSLFPLLPPASPWHRGRAPRASGDPASTGTVGSPTSRRDNGVKPEPEGGRLRQAGLRTGPQPTCCPRLRVNWGADGASPGAQVVGAADGSRCSVVRVAAGKADGQ